jgi:hypothetical protein
VLPLRQPSFRLQMLLHRHQMTEPVIDSLPSHERARVARLWARRGQNERASSGAFVWVARAIAEEGFGDAAAELARRAVNEELAHDAVCKGVARVYAEGADYPEVQVPVEPDFGFCARRMGRLLGVTLQTAINESLATAYLGECLTRARSEVARSALRDLLRDEVEHARIGWAVLASPRLSAEERARLAEHLPLLFELMLSAWLADDADYPEDLPEGHGIVSGRVIAGAIQDAVTNVLLPGFRHVGVDTSAVQRWLASAPRSAQ